MSANEPPDSYSRLPGSDSETSELDEIIAEFVDANESGDIEDLVRQHPRFESELRSFYADYVRCERKVAPIHGRSPKTSDWAGRSFGKYQVIEEIGRGGMGVVYRARDRDLGREVALKMVLAGPQASETEIERFRVEATAAAGLNHADVVRVYDSGKLAEHHYITMELVEGAPLHRFLRKRDLSPRDIARLVRRVALAVDHAHERRVLHRDLKPSNILVDDVGSPHVTDFGLAKVIDLDSSLTLSGAYVGTPRYMPPEYLSEDGKRGTVAGDVYSLGAVLYECLTGRAPFVGASPLDVLVQVRDTEPPRPRLLRPELPIDLETICLKALDKNPSRRYPSAREFADDLERQMDGRPIQARPVSAWTRAVKWARRHPTVTLLATLSVAALTALVAGVLYHSRTMEKALNETRRREQENEVLLYAARIRLAQSAYEEGRFEELDELLEAARPSEGESDLRGIEWTRLRRLASARRFSLGAWAIPNVAALDPRGRFFALAKAADLGIWDLTTGTYVATLTGYTHDPHDMTFSSDGRFLAIGTAEHGGVDRRGELVVWDLDAPPGPPLIQDFPIPVRRLTFHPSRPVIAATFDRIERIDVFRVDGQIEPVGSLAANQSGDPTFSVDGRQLLAADSREEQPGLRVWNWESKAEPQFVPTPRAVYGLALDSGGRWLAGHTAHRVEIWDQNLRRPSKTVSRNLAEGIQRVRFVPGTNLVAVLGRDENERGVLALFRMTGERLDDVGRFVLSPSAEWRTLSFSPRGELFAVGGRNPAVFDLEGLLAPRRIIRTEDELRDVAYTHDGRFVVCGRRDGAVELRSSRTGERVGTLGRHRPKSVEVVERLPESDWMLTGSTDHHVKIWDLSEQREVASLHPHRGVVRSLAPSPNGDRLAVGSYQRVRVWDLRPLRRDEQSREGHELERLCIAEFHAHDDRVHGAKWHPTAERLVTGGSEGRVRFWHTTGWDLVHEIMLDSEVLSLDVSHEGEFLAVGANDGRIRLWRLDNALPVGNPKILSRTFEAGALPLAFTPDDGRLLAETPDRRLRIFATESGQELGTFRGQTLQSGRIDVSPQGDSIATAKAGLRIWNVSTVTSHRVPAGAGARSPDVYRRLAQVSHAAVDERRDDTVLWSRIPVKSLPATSGATDVAAGDLDDDGDLDLYVTFDGENALLLNNGAGTFECSQVLPLQRSGNYDLPLFVDVNGDRRLDLALQESSRGLLVCLATDGAFRAPMEVSGSSFRHTWVDIDDDGRLDLVTDAHLRVGSYLRSTTSGVFEPHKLAGVKPSRISFHPTWRDLDLDGDLDLFLLGGKSKNVLFERVDAETFRHLTASPLEVPGRENKRATWFDLNNDGLSEIYLTCASSPDLLFAQTKPLAFERHEIDFRRPPLSAVRPVASDYDLDGDVDLFVPENDGHSRLLRNDDGHLVDVTGEVFNTLGSATGAIFEDLDGDGDPDLFVSNYDGTSTMLRNELTPGRHWLTIDLQGRKSNRRGVGATVRITAGGKSQWRQVVAEPGAPSPRAHFGLGDVETVEELEVRWPSGTVTTLARVKTDHAIVVSEGE